MSAKPLNPALFAVLQKRFGQVGISSPGEPMRWHIETDNQGKRFMKIDHGGEQYVVCCPICRDHKPRLNICHAWLTRPSAEFPLITHKLKCEHENCKELYRESFYKSFLKDLGNPDGISEMFAQHSAPEKEQEPMRLPVGTIPLHELPDDHPAIQFLNRKYNGLTKDLLGKGYGALFASEYDKKYPAAKNRIIFPLISGGQFMGWQGRDIYPNKVNKYIFCSGVHKCFFNGDNVDSSQIPILCEGVLSAIACGPCGIAIFGNHLNNSRCREFASRWKTAIIALDPETQIPDTRKGGGNKILAQILKKELDEVCKIPVHILKWPDYAMEEAKYKFAHPELECKVTDAADIGIVGMYDLLNSVPPVYKGLV